MIAALYIDPRGPYPRIPGVDCWDESRDARLYDGPHPVIAHPPCGPWGRLKRWATKDSPALAVRAVEQVRKFGGVLEHPAGSELFGGGKLFRQWQGETLCFGELYLPRPTLGEHYDSFGGYTIEVRQVEWGHVAEKRTWLYVVGVPRLELEHPPFPGRAVTHWISGVKTRAKNNGGCLPAHMKFCSNQQRRRTPPLFAEYLVRLASSAWETRKKRAGVRGLL